MALPKATIDETRGDVRVVVYGDASPVTEVEWYCARLLHAREILPLVIDATEIGRVYCGNEESTLAEIATTREGAVAAYRDILEAMVKHDMRIEGVKATRLREEAAAVSKKAAEHDACKAELQAILDGRPT